MRNCSETNKFNLYNATAQDAILPVLTANEE